MIIQLAHIHADASGPDTSACSSRMGLTGPISRWRQVYVGRERLRVRRPAPVIVRPMRGCVIMASSQRTARAIVPVLAEIDEAARALAPSGIELERAARRRPRRPTAPPRSPPAWPSSSASTSRCSPGRPPRRRRTRCCAASPTRCADDDVDFFVTLDADGQHDGRQIPDLVRANLARRQWDDHRLALDARRLLPRHRLVPRSRSAAPATSWSAAVTGLRGVHDATTSFRVYAREVAQLLRPETPARRGLRLLQRRSSPSPGRTASRSTRCRSRSGRATAGCSKLHPRDMVDFTRNLPTVRRQVARDPPRDRRSNQADVGAAIVRAAIAGRRRPTRTFGAAEELENLA